MPGLHRWGLVAQTPTPFSPVVDGDVLPVDPWTGLARGDAADVPLVVGHNRDEWQLFLLLAGRLGRVDPEFAAGALATFGPGQLDAGTATGPELERLVSTTLSDRMFRMPSLQLAVAHTAGGGRAHVYELTWPSPALGGALGACHALDVPLVFGTLEAPNMFSLLPTPPTLDVLEVSETFQQAWTAFAATGDPGWPAWTESDAATFVVDAGDRGGLRAYPEEASRQLWAGRLPRVLDLL
jgi:para-nitrobenzyl esterase